MSDEFDAIVRRLRKDIEEALDYGAEFFTTPERDDLVNMLLVRINEAILATQAACNRRSASRRPPFDTPDSRTREDREAARREHLEAHG